MHVQLRFTCDPTCPFTGNNASPRRLYHVGAVVLHMKGYGY